MTRAPGIGICDEVASVVREVGAHRKCRAQLEFHVRDLAAFHQVQRSCGEMLVESIVEVGILCHDLS